MERYGDTVFRLAYSYLKNRADAEDVMQETLLKLYLERKPFRSPEHERYWVVRVAVNESKKLLRSPWRRRTGPLEEAGEPVFDTPQQGAGLGIQQLILQGRAASVDNQNVHVYRLLFFENARGHPHIV